MISKITINDPTHLPLPWWTKAKVLKDIKEITFTPGLNIFWGKNGAGKSSVLRLMAKMFHAEAGRFTFVTGDSLREMIPFKSKSNEHPTDNLFNSMTIEHDSQGVMYFDPDHKPGLMGGMAGFDYDFMSAGLNAIFAKGSSGELGIHNLAKLLDGIKKGDKIPVKWKHKPKGDKIPKSERMTTEFFQGNIPDGPPTFLLDEPDRSVDIPNQLRLWTFLKEASKQVQIIVASHSVFGATIAGANYVEFSPGYLTMCRNTIDNWSDAFPRRLLTDERAGTKNQGHQG